jgi:centrosomal protein CEP104
MEPQRIKFKIIYCFGEEEKHPSSELYIHSPATKGWQSPKFCEYPQELIFQLEGTTALTQIQILSHQVGCVL